MRRTVTKVFTIADFEEEEIWLREQHKKGWKLTGMTPPCFYRFESCEPEDVIYRLDFGSDDRPNDYMQMLSDFGWEHFADCLGWSYFRKPASETVTEEEGEIFSDDESRAEQVTKVMRSRLLPVVLLFFCTVLPNFMRMLDGEYIGFWGKVYSGFFSIVFALDVFLIVYCTVKLKKIRSRYKD